VEGSVGTLTELGEVVNRTDPLAAEVYLLRAERIAKKAGYLDRFSAIHSNLGRAVMSQGRLPKAKDYLERALQEARGMKSPWFTAIALNLLGEWYIREHRDLSKAWNLFEEARVIGESTHFDEPQAAALFGLSRVALANGDLASARSKALESVELYRSMKHFMAGEVQSWIDAQDWGDAG
jgi:tetratricopeptide (TPR) repeat protein